MNGVAACGAGTFGEDCAEECGCGPGAARCDPATGCTCKTGWTGAKCNMDLDECQTLSIANECSEQNALCHNFHGGYRCDCSPGYVKSESTAPAGVSICEGEWTAWCLSFSPTLVQFCNKVVGGFF